MTVTVADFDTTAPLTGAVTTTFGAPVSTTTETLADVVLLPAASRATALSVWVPAAAVAVFQTKLWGAVVTSDPRLVPFSLNCTPATPTLSIADATSAIEPETVNPVVGDVMEMTGATLSMFTVTVMLADVVLLPAASRAIAVRVWEPADAVLGFQTTEKGAA